MPDLSFSVSGVEEDARAAAPQLIFKLRIANATQGRSVQSIALQCQVQIEATRRRYSAVEQQRLVELFGEPDQWSRTLGRVFWAQTTSVVGAFKEETTIDLRVPCTCDFNVAATKYVHGLEGGDVPIAFLFSGTVFYANAEGRLQVSQIPWDKEAAFRMPAGLWRDLMDRGYPHSTWLRVRRDVFERLLEHKRRCGLPTFDAALESLLAAEPAEVPA